MRSISPTNSFSKNSALVSFPSTRSRSPRFHVRQGSAIVLDELAIIFPLGTVSRRPEAASLAQALSRFRKLEHVILPGTLEGGDVVWLDDRTVAVGRGYRTNTEGIRQFAAILGEAVTVLEVPLPHCLSRPPLPVSAEIRFSPTVRGSIQRHSLATTGSTSTRRTTANALAA